MRSNRRPHEIAAFCSGGRASSAKCLTCPAVPSFGAGSWARSSRAGGSRLAMQSTCGCRPSHSSLCRRSRRTLRSGLRAVRCSRSSGDRHGGSRSTWRHEDRGGWRICRGRPGCRAGSIDAFRRDGTLGLGMPEDLNQERPAAAGAIVPCWLF